MVGPGARVVAFLLRGMGPGGVEPDHERRGVLPPLGDGPPWQGTCAGSPGPAVVAGAGQPPTMAVERGGSFRGAHATRIAPGGYSMPDRQKDLRDCLTAYDCR